MMLLTNVTSVNSRESSIDESLCPYSVCPSLEIFVSQTVKNLPAMQETRFNPWFRKIPWRREWQPAPVFLPRESHGQSLESYSPWGHKELDMTE